MGEKPKTQDLSEILSTCKTSEQVLKEVSLYYPRVSNAVTELRKLILETQYYSEFVNIEGPQKLKKVSDKNYSSNEMIFLLLPSLKSRAIPCLAHRHPYRHGDYRAMALKFSAFPEPFTRYYTSFEVMGSFDDDKLFRSVSECTLLTTTVVPVTALINDKTLHDNTEYEESKYEYTFDLRTNKNGTIWLNDWKVYGLKVPLAELNLREFKIGPN